MLLGIVVGVVAVVVLYACWVAVVVRKDKFNLF